MSPLNSGIAAVGIDIGKNSFHVVAAPPQSPVVNVADGSSSTDPTSLACRFMSASPRKRT